MRPKSIVYFERIMFGTLALGLIQSALGWNRATELASANRLPGAFLPIISVLTIVILAGLVLLVSRYRSRVVAWILIILTAIGIPGFLAQVAHGLLLGSGLITAVQIVGEIIAFAFLFTPSARAWLRTRPQKIAHTAATLD